MKANQSGATNPDIVRRREWALALSSLLACACAADGGSKEAVGNRPSLDGGQGAARHDDGGAGAGEGPEPSSDDQEPELLALGNCDLSAPFEAPVPAFTGSMDADGLTFSADGMTAYISGAGPGGRDIYVATRMTPDGTFSTPQLLGPVNTPAIERAPSLSPDGKLYFTRQSNGWFDIGRAVGAAPQFTGAEVVPAPVSSSYQDEDPFWWGSNTLYFVSEVDNGGAHRDIWMATWNGTTFSAAQKVQGQNVQSSAEEFRPVLSPDGLTLYFGSRRIGIGNDTDGDIWMARRTPTNPVFQPAVNLASLNNTGIDFPVNVSPDGCTLYFANNEETGLGSSPNFRLYQAKRGASTPAQVTLRLNIIGQGSVTQAPFNCGPGNTGTCSASAPPDTQLVVNASSQATWTGSCAANGGQPSTDGILVFSQNAVCTIKFPNGTPAGAGGLCSLSIDCQPGLACTNNTCGGCTAGGHCRDRGEICGADADCRAGLVCGEDNGRRFDQAGARVCWDPRCQTDQLAQLCGAPTSTCGRCTNDPLPCTTNAQCPSGFVCGTANGGRFGLAPASGFCWPTVCTTAPDAPGNCGSASSLCGRCDCTAACAAATCGNPPPGCSCPGSCGTGQPGCQTDPDCTPGNVCGIGVGPRFGLPAGTNVCWDNACRLQDPSKPNCGVGSANCGTCPVCTPNCAQGSGPDGCGGCCGQDEVPLAGGQCVTVLANEVTNPALPLPVSLRTTDVVGALAGTFTVTDQGAASYVIPIEVPPGRMGLQPSLSLRYMSTKADGLMGLGWTLGGLSSISVCGKIVDRDGVAAPPALGGSTGFCLDGMGLIRVNPDGQLDGAEFRTEIDSFRKVIAHASGSSPDWFEVFTKDGLILTYGKSRTSKVSSLGLPTRVWGVDSVSDRSGNKYQITYDVRQTTGVAQPGVGELIPLQISYGPFVVAFDYEERTSPLVRWTAGMLGYGTQRLKSVTTLFGSDVVRAYRIAYEQNRADRQSRVSSIKECALDVASSSEVCKSATTFEYSEVTNYGAPQTAFTLPMQQGQAYHDACPGHGTINCEETNSENCQALCIQYAQEHADSVAQTISLDVNGDGLADLLTQTDDGMKPFWCPSCVEGHSVWQLGVGNGLGDFENQGEVLLGKNPGHGCINQGSVIDLDRDGFDDIVNLCPGAAPGGLFQPLTVYYSTGSGVGAPVELSTVVSGALRLADIDGDGRKDLVTCEEGGEYASQQVYLNRNDSFTEPVDLDPGHVTRGICQAMLAFDIDGDGADEVVTFQRGYSPEGEEAVIEVYDWEPTGAGEPLPHGDDPHWRSWGRSPAPLKGCATRSYVVGCDEPRALDGIRLIDINGDGLKDIVHHFTGTFTTSPLTLSLQMLVNTGTRFQPLRATAGNLGFIGPVPNLKIARPLDVDGNGSEELLIPGGALRWITTDTLDYVPITDVPLSFSQLVLADVDGDSTPDLITTHAPAEGSTDYDRSVSVYLSKPIPGGPETASGVAGLLTRITDGVGKRWAIDYRSSHISVEVTGPAGPNTPPPTGTFVRYTYNKGGCASNPTTNCLSRVGPLVRAYVQLQVSPTGEFKRETQYSYRYTAARVGLGGRGMFGFEEREEDLDGLEPEIEHRHTTTTYNNLDLVRAGTVTKIERVFSYLAPGSEFAINQPNGVRREIIDYMWQARQHGSVAFPFLSFHRADIFEGSGSDRLSQTLYVHYVDDFGNPTYDSETTFAGGRDLGARIVTRTYEPNDEDRWLPGRLSTESVQDEAPSGATVTRTRRWAYVPRTMLVKTLETQGDLEDGGPDPDRPNEYQLTTYNRTQGSTGNVTGVCVSGAGITQGQRCSTVLAWDEFDIFPTRIRDSLGALETEAHTSNRDGSLLWQRDANGSIAQFSRDAFGRVQQATSPTADTTFRYAVATPHLGTPFNGGPGFTVWSAYSIVTQPAGQGATTESFDAFGRTVDTVTMGFGGTQVQSERQYGGLGHLIAALKPHAVGDASQGATTYTFDGLGRRRTQTDASGLTTSYFYATTQTVAPAFASAFAADESVAPLTAAFEKSPRGNARATVLDHRGARVRTVEYPNVTTAGATAGTGAATVTYRTGPFAVVDEIDAPGGVTTIVPDGLGRPLVISDPAMGSLTRTYDGFGQVRETTDGNEQTTLHDYDGDGRLVSVTDSSSNVLLRMVYGDQDGLAPNTLGRVVGIYRSSASLPGKGNWIRYSYTPQISGSGMQNRALVSKVTYGLGGVPTNKDSAVQRFEVGFDYQDEASGTSTPWRVDKIHYPSQGGAFAVQYEYDNGFSGAIRSVHPPGDTNLNHAYWRLLDTDQGFRPSLEQFGNGVQTISRYYSLAPGGRPAECGNADTACEPGLPLDVVTRSANELLVQSARYTYDSNLNLQTLEKSRTEGQVEERHEYHHDGFDRLQDDRLVGHDTFTHFYDLAGNITMAGPAGRLDTYTYDPDNPTRVTSANGIAYSDYDGNGNLGRRGGASVPSGRQTFTYDVFNKPTKVAFGSGSGFIATDIEYAGANRIIKRKRAGNPGPNDLCPDDPAACVEEQTIDIGDFFEEIDRFSAGGCDPLDAEADPAAGRCVASSRTYRYRILGGVGQVAEVERTAGGPSRTVYFHRDHLGSATAITDADGGRLERRSFSAFGEPSGFDFSTSPTGVLSGFTGHQQDDDLGLVNMKGRLYDATLGRFITADPLMTGSYARSLNRYAYVENNPLSFVDPSGYQQVDFPTCPGGCCGTGCPSSTGGGDDGGAAAAAANQAAAAAAASASASVAQQACDPMARRRAAEMAGSEGQGHGGHPIGTDYRGPDPGTVAAAAAAAGSPPSTTPPVSDQPPPPGGGGPTGPGSPGNGNPYGGALDSARSAMARAAGAAEAAGAWDLYHEAGMWSGHESSMKHFWETATQDARQASDWSTARRAMDKMERFGYSRSFGSPPPAGVLKYAGPLGAMLSAWDGINAAMRNDGAGVAVSSFEVLSELVGYLGGSIGKAWDMGVGIGGVLSDLASLNRATNDLHILVGAGIATLLGIQADDGGTPWMPFWSQ